VVRRCCRGGEHLRRCDGRRWSYGLLRLRRRRNGRGLRGCGRLPWSTCRLLLLLLWGRLLLLASVPKHCLRALCGGCQGDAHPRREDDLAAERPPAKRGVERPGRHGEVQHLVDGTYVRAGR
jgi:hypothetical protein